MFRLVYQNKVVGTTMLESGDPSLGCASGALVEAGTCAAMGDWILAQGGAEDDGVFFLEIGREFLALLGEHTTVPFETGSIICVPESDEIFLELDGIPAPEYAHFFPEHVKAFQQANPSSAQPTS